MQEMLFPNPSIVWTPQNTCSLATCPCTLKKKKKDESSWMCFFLVVYFIFQNTDLHKYLLSAQEIKRMK